MIIHSTMSLPKKKCSTRTSEEQEILSTPSVSLTPPKRITSTYTPPHLPTTHGAITQTAPVTHLDLTPNPFSKTQPPVWAQISGANLKSIMGTTPTTTPQPSKSPWTIRNHFTTSTPHAKETKYYSHHKSARKITRHQSQFTQSMPPLIGVQLQQPQQGVVPLVGVQMQ